MESGRDISKILVSPTETLQALLHVFAAHKPAETGAPSGIVLVVDRKRKLLGIVTYGDLIRSLAHGMGTLTPVTEIMNKNPFVIDAAKSREEMLAIITEAIQKERWHKNRLEKIILVNKRDKTLVDVLNLSDLLRASNPRFKRIGVVGLGYVGLTLGLTFADLGFKVHAVDKNAELVRAIGSRRAPFFEEGMNRMLKEHVGSSFRLVEHFKGDNYADVYFIAVGTPLKRKQKPDLSFIQDAVEQVGSVLKAGDIVILRSTVPLGTTRTVVAPLLEKISGLRAGEDFFVVFAPERTIEGKALQELRTLPQVIGGINHASSNEAAALFNAMTETVLIVDSLEEAEVVKLINNTYRDVTFAFANEVALICQRWGIDTNKVIHAANMGYERSRVPQPSPGVGGYCLEKDPFIFMQGAETKGHSSGLFREARRTNEKILREVGNHVKKFLMKRSRVKRQPKLFILGFAFKGHPPTSDIRGSSTVKLVRMLRKAGIENIHGYDPVVPALELTKLSVKVVKKLEDGFKGADAIVIMNNHERFKALNIRKLLDHAAPQPLLYDTWAHYSRENIERFAGVDYRRL